jgi:hypothetical protein
MTWEIFYLSCFCIGLVLSILSFAGGFGHLHLGHIRLGHVRVGHAGHHTGNAFSPFNGFTLMAFLCWFGGAGYLLTRYHLFSMGLALTFAVVTGVAGAALIFLFLARVLLPCERVLLPEDTEMRGTIARVSSSLRVNGTGEILFSLNGTRRCAAARAETGEAIPRDAQVLILRYDRGIAWVRPFSELEAFASASAPSAAARS